MQLSFSHFGPPSTWSSHIHHFPHSPGHLPHHPTAAVRGSLALLTKHGCKGSHLKAFMKTKLLAPLAHAAAGCPFPEGLAWPDPSRRGKGSKVAYSPSIHLPNRARAATLSSQATCDQACVRLVSTRHHSMRHKHTLHWLTNGSGHQPQ